METSDINRFWSKVKKTKTCWLWVGAKTSHGYGSINIKHKRRPAHRVVFEIIGKPIPAGLFVLHKCDITFCVNPSHLFFGTHTDNMRDMVAKGRSKHCVFAGETNYNAKLTQQQVNEIRNKYTKRGYRYYDENNKKITTTEIGKTYGVTQVMISYVLIGKNWR